METTAVSQSSVRKLKKGGKQTKILMQETVALLPNSDQKCQHFVKPVHNIDGFNAALITKTV